MQPKTLKEALVLLPTVVDKEFLEKVDTVFHLDFVGADGGQYTLIAKEGELKIEEGLVGISKCTISGKAKNMTAILTGKANPVTSVMLGKIKISNKGELLKHLKLLGVM